MIRALKKIGALRRLYYRTRLMLPRGQSDETDILRRLTSTSTKTFVEFGFHPIQFNCVELAKTKGWRGMLIDSDEHQVRDAAAVLPQRVSVKHAFLTAENLAIVASAFSKLGVLSIDVDGNDYWFLKELITVSPDVISIEYNASLGLDPITVPYDPAFDRMKKHHTGWYHGASLSAISQLCSRHGYGLTAVSKAGANAFFSKDGNLDPLQNWRPNALRNQWSKTTPNEQWQAISHLPFIKV